jgi:hypothetical protein
VFLPVRLAIDKTDADGGTSREGHVPDPDRGGVEDLVREAQRLRAAGRLEAPVRVPDDTGEEDDTTARSRGSAFHELIAAALLNNDPAAVSNDAIKSAEASEQQQLRWLFDRHQQLTDADPYPVTYRRTEYEMGITLLAPGVDMASRTARYANEPSTTTRHSPRPQNG